LNIHASDADIVDVYIFRLLTYLLTYTENKPQLSALYREQNQNFFVSSETKTERKQTHVLVFDELHRFTVCRPINAASRCTPHDVCLTQYTYMPIIRVLLAEMCPRGQVLGLEDPRGQMPWPCESSP